MEKLMDFLDELELQRIYYRLDKVRESVMVEISIPGQRWEVEFFSDGHMEVEKFFSDGNVLNAVDWHTLIHELRMLDA